MGGFEISPMEPKIDIFLPLSWITRHPPQGIWTSAEIQFNSTTCLEKYTKYKTEKFSLTWDDSVAKDSSARIIGYVATAGNNGNALGDVPIKEKYMKYETEKFSLTWDDSVAKDPSARIIGYAATAGNNGNALGDVPIKFQQYLGIMCKDAIDVLPDHSPYDCKIDL